MHTDIPDLPAELVTRAAVLERLDGVLQQPITFLTSPAGTGKTTALAQWCRQRCPLPARWMDAAALGVALAEGAALHDVLLEGGRGVVLLDRVDDAGTAHIATAVADLADRLRDADMHLVVAGRLPPPAAAVALELRHVAAHIDHTALVLTPPETAALFASYARTTLPASAAAELCTALDGWIAPVVVAARSAGADGHQVTGMVTGVRGELRAYFEAEILGTISPEDRAWLTRLAFVEQIHPDLARAVTGVADSQRIIEDLRTIGFPLQRDHRDHHSFRLLRPLRECLDEDATRADPDGRRAAARTAATWFGEHGRPLEAARCWSMVNEWDQLLEVILLHMQQIIEADDYAEVIELVGSVPPKFLLRHPDLVLGGAWILRMDGRIAAADELLTAFEPRFTPFRRLIAVCARSSVASWVEDVEGALGLAESAVAGFENYAGPLDRKSLTFFTESGEGTYWTLAKASALLASTYLGVWDRAQHHLVELDPWVGSRLAAVEVLLWQGYRATYHAMAGEAAAALAAGAVALGIAEGSGLLGHRLAADAYYALGEASRLTLDHPQAADWFDRALVLATSNGRRNLSAAIVAAQAHLDIDRGRTDEALEHLGAHAGIDHRYPAEITSRLAAAHARALTAAGDDRRALDVLRTTPQTASSASAAVAAAVAGGRVALARTVIDRWPAGPPVDNHVRRLVALAATQPRTSDAARAAMHAALDAAAAQRLMQPFVELGPSVANLAREGRASDASSEAAQLVADMRAAIARGGVPALAPRLTAAEVQILDALGEGRTFQDVADRVHLSAHTVRTHVRSIYRKLGVNSRVEAVRVWRSPS